MGQRGIYIECLASGFILFAGEHGTERAHVVQTVGHFDEDYPNVFGHGEQQPSKILGLSRCLVAENTARYFGEPVDDGCYLFPEVVLDVLDGIFSVFHYVVQQGGAYRCRAQTYFLTDDTSHGDGVQYVGFARSSAYSLVGFFGKFERTLDNLDFLPVVGVEISVEQFLKFIFDKLLFVGVLLIGRFHSSKSKKNKDKTSREQMQILFEN